MTLLPHRKTVSNSQHYAPPLTPLHCPCRSSRSRMATHPCGVKCPQASQDPMSHQVYVTLCSLNSINSHTWASTDLNP